MRNALLLQLNDDPGSTPVNHKRVARIMASLKLFDFTKKRKVITTVSDKKKPVFPDLVKRHFNALAANEVYIGDITYLPIADGTNMYLATVIDCYSRRLVGFAIGRSYAHILGSGGIADGEESARQPQGRGVPFGSRQRVHLASIPKHLCLVGDPAIDGICGNQR